MMEVAHPQLKLHDMSNHHHQHINAQLFTARCSSIHPTNTVKALKTRNTHTHSHTDTNTHTHSHTDTHTHSHKHTYTYRHTHTDRYKPAYSVSNVASWCIFLDVQHQMMMATLVLVEPVQLAH